MVQTYTVQQRRPIGLFIFFILLAKLSVAQYDGANKYWVFYTDKHETQFDPYTYFSPEAIARRHREGIALIDSSDFPLNQSYVEALSKLTTQYVGESRWLNASVCYLTPMGADEIQKLPFVSRVEQVASRAMEPCVHLLSEYDEKLLHAQTHIMQYSAFEEKKLNGKGITIAIFDAGFEGTLNNPQLKHVIDNKQIKATYNFVLEKNFVFDYHTHGTMVLSCIAGQKGNTPMGFGTESSFLLARTEQTSSESQIEEDNWIRSLEWADKNGADIVNSSLGYTHQLYKRDEMTGHSHLMAQAANTAFGKGILIVNSAGNEGIAWWEIVTGPADADSILTVGGIDPRTGMHHPQSSYGPNTSGTMKPNVSAFFSAIVSVGGKLQRAEGTSFSSPLVAGFAACVWQLHPEWTVRQVYHEIQKSGHLYPYFDYAHGYGIPQATYFTDSLKAIPKQFDLIYFQNDETYHLQICEPSDDEMTFATDAQENLHQYVYYHLCDEQGQILTYHVVQPESFNGAEIETTNCDDCLIRAHYRGQTITTTRQKIRNASLIQNPSE